MALTIHVDFSFKKESPVDQVKLGKSIIAGLTNNPSLFPNPPVDIKDLQTFNDALSTDVDDVEKTDSKQARSNIKNSRENWIDAFGKTGQYVDLQAQGLESTIIAAGYSATKNFRQKKTIPQVASGFKAGTNGVGGSLTGVIENLVPDAMAFVYYALPAGVTVSFTDNTMILTVGTQQVFINITTKRNTEIYTLAGKQTFNVGVFAMNAAGIGPSTPTQSVTTQG